MLKRLSANCAKVTDLRRKWGNLRHKLVNILVIALLSIICNGENFTDMENFGKEREKFLRRFLELPNGIPNADTFRRILERAIPAEGAK